MEGYSGTRDRGGKVRQGGWNPERNERDRKDHDALAARGYWQAFNVVKESVSKVLIGKNPGTLARAEHKEWYGELFQPCVTAGLFPALELGRYRNNAVYLRKVRYAPPRCGGVRRLIPAFFYLPRKETEPSSRR